MKKSNLMPKLTRSNSKLLILFVIFIASLFAFSLPNLNASAEDPQGTSTSLISQLTASSTLILTPTVTNTISPTSTFTPTPTQTLTPTSTQTQTPTQTPSPTPTQTSTPTKIFLIFPVSNSVTPYFGGTLFVISIIIFILLNARTTKVHLSPSPKSSEYTGENPEPIYKPVKKSENAINYHIDELSDELVAGFKLLRELYDVTSKAQSDIFVSIADLEMLLKQKYPEKNVDLLKIAIEIANTQDGLLKIQQAREDIYLIQVL